MDQYVQSGLPQHAFCDSISLAYSTFSRWRQRLKIDATGHAGVPTSDLFVEVTDSPTADAVPPPVWDVELQLGQAMFLRLRTLSC